MTAMARLTLVILLGINSGLYAQDNALSIPSLYHAEQHQSEQHQWRQVSTEMSPGEYREACNYNQRLARVDRPLPLAAVEADPVAPGAA